MSKELLTVMVTGIGGGGHGEQILKTLLLVAAGRYRIVGADMNPSCSRFAVCDAHYVLPPANDPDYMPRLLSICRVEGVKALFHGCEPELKVHSCNRELIEREGILLPINGRETIEMCMDKAATMRFLTEHGMTPPAYWVVNSTADLGKVDRFPVVIKPSVGSGGSANVHIAQTSRELGLFGELLRLGESEITFMIQEYVGTPDDEYTVGVLHDLDGNFLNSIALRREIKSTLNIRVRERNRTDRSDLGPWLVISSGLSHGRIDDYADVRRQCENIAKAVDARGAINIQCRMVDGKVKVFEINPRFSGTTSIRALMGYNEPDLLIRRHIFGEKIQPRFGYDNGLILRSIVENILERTHAIGR